MYILTENISTFHDYNWKESDSYNGIFYETFDDAKESLELYKSVGIELGIVAVNN